MEEYTGSAIITGACGGIGAAISSRFASAGMALGLCDVRPNELDQLAGPTLIGQQEASVT